MKTKNSKRNDAEGLPELALDASLFTAGDRICVAVSGGADSTALLRALLSRRGDLGVVLSVLHVEHGLRGDASRQDAEFVATLADKFGLPCEIVGVDTEKRAADRKETIEEAARNLRYEVFRTILSADKADKVATAHTLDDQAETVLMKLLRGAWTEGLSGIHPTLRLVEPAGSSFDCVRPLLGVRRAEIEAYLRAMNQLWREDETNRSQEHTRNRVRHRLLPSLREFNPQIDRMLAHIADNARAEEAHWAAELARVLPQILLPGKPVRGGGRSVATAPGSMAVAVELARLKTLDPGLQRRVLRAAAEQCGTVLDFEQTERLFAMTNFATAGSRQQRVTKRIDLAGGVRVERTARELQFERVLQDTARERQSGASAAAFPSSELPEYILPVPGEVEAPWFSAHYTARICQSAIPGRDATRIGEPAPILCIRAWKPGDRVELRHSSGPKKVKEILERLGVRGEERAHWPVAVYQGKIVWMRGVEFAAQADTEGNGTADFPILHVKEVRTVTKM